MQPEDFIVAYESALASQDWSQVAPLMDESIGVTFSDGSVHIGKTAVREAFENNFSKIKSEKYAMTNITWLKKEANIAAYMFNFSWSGFVNDQLISGEGLGTSTIIKQGVQWKLIAEHLGKKKKL